MDDVDHCESCFKADSRLTTYSFYPGRRKKEVRARQLEGRLHRRRDRFVRLPSGPHVFKENWGQYQRYVAGTWTRGGNGQLLQERTLT